MSLGRRFRAPLLVLAIACMLSASALGQTNCEIGAQPLREVQPEGISTAEILQRALANESSYKSAHQQYTYTQEIKVQTLRPGMMRGDLLADGEYRQIAEVSFDPHGHRLESVTFAPQNTLRRVTMTQEDFDDILERASFVLLPETRSQYVFHYAGQQHVDEIDTYVFDVAPQQVQKHHRYFQGRVWIEVRDLGMVKSCGKTVPDEVLPPKKKRGRQNLHPTFATYRDRIDGKYWLPVYMRSDDFLHFRGGDVRIRATVKFTNYRKPEPKNPHTPASTLQKAAH